MKKNLLLLYTLVCAVNLYAADHSVDLYQKEPNLTDAPGHKTQEHWNESNALIQTLNLLPAERKEFEQAYFHGYMAQPDYSGIVRRKAKLFAYLNNNIPDAIKAKALKDMIRAAQTNYQLDQFVQSQLGL